MNRRSRASLATVLGLVIAAAALPARAAAANPHDWPMYQHDIRRSGYDPKESKVNRTSVGLLRLKCAFHAGDAITASPAVIHFDDFNGQGPRKVVYVGSADENFYAIDAADCSKIWNFTADPAPGLAYHMFVSSAFVDLERRQVYVGGGYTMYALDLYNGTLKWKWSTALNPPDGTTHGGGEIETSPLLVGDKVYFGSDRDGVSPSVSSTGNVYPALFAVNAGSGTLEWYWRPSTMGSCGAIWSSVSADPDLGLLYFGTADCGRAVQGPYNESVIALPIEPPPGSVDSLTKRRADLPSWYYQPWYLDPYDVDFGSTPLLFDRDGVQYLGIGGKDGFYYVLRRQGGTTPGEFRNPEWKTRVVRGGFGGGFVGSTATDGNTIWGATALFDLPPGPNPQVQPPFVHAFDAAGGQILWQQVVTGPTFAATTAVPGVVFIGSIDHSFTAVDADTGQVLFAFPASATVSSGAAISDGEVFVGTGTKGFGSGEGPTGSLFVFALPDGAPKANPNEPPPLPPAAWPLGVLQYPIPDRSTPNPKATPTP